MTSQNNTMCEYTQLSEEQEYFINIYVLFVEISGNLITGVIGMILNIITIIIFSTSKLRNSIFNQLLISLAVFDNLYLLCEIFEVFREWFHPFFLQYAFAKFIYPIRSVFMCSSIYTNIALATERYQAITSPIEYRVRRTTNITRKLLKYIIPIMTLSFIYYTPKFFEIDVEETLDCASSQSLTHYLGTTQRRMDEENCTFTYSLTPTKLRINRYYLLWYMNVSNIFITALVPTAILVYLNVNVYLSLDEFLQRRHSRYHSNVSMNTYQRQQSIDVKKTFILFSIVFLFIFCHSLRLILNLDELVRLGSSQEDYENECKLSRFWEEVLIPLNQLLLIINASAHFFIYVFFDAEFRQVLKGRSPPIRHAVVLPTIRLAVVLSRNRNNPDMENDAN